MPKILIQKGKKEFVEELNREVTTIKQKNFFLQNINKDFQLSGSLISKNELKKNGEIIKDNRGKDFLIFESTFVDDYKRLKRLPQTIPLKDIGLILAETGINRTSKVLDSGTGSGALTIMLANFVKEVHSYDVREDHLKAAQDNVDFLKLKNIKLKKQDINEGILEKDFDLITLDLPEPWKTLKHCINAMNIGAFIVCYSITVPQLQDFVEAVRKEEKLMYVKTVEIQERLWEVDGRKVKPKTISIGHSGFLTFVRKVLK
ncbi:methyltransferase domain-containing protein [archaeon]|nr:methyltransferase domain-containing protein [archaeon]